LRGNAGRRGKLVCGREKSIFPGKDLIHEDRGCGRGLEKKPLGVKHPGRVF